MSEMPIGHGGHSPLSGAGKKVGPLPVWGWGLLLGGIAVAYLWMHSQASNAANATPANTDPSQTQPDASGSVTDPGLANDLSALQESVDSIQTAQTALNNSNAEQTKQLSSQEKQIKNLEHDHKHKHEHKHEHKQPHPHGGHAAKPHHEHKRKHPHVSGGK